MTQSRGGDPTNDSSHPVASQAASPAQSGGGSVWARGLRVIRTVLWMLVVLGSLAGIVLLRVQAGEIDYATANVATYLLAFVVVTALVTRMVFRRSAHWMTRWLPITGVLLAILVSCVLLRVDRVSGRLVPKLAWRWSPKPDQLLTTPVVSAGSPVDMQTTTPGDFPQFLGPQRNLVVTGIELDRDWTAHPPRQLWRQPIGAGWSEFQRGQRLRHDAWSSVDRKSWSRATRFSTGKPRWVHSITARYETISGGVGPRSTPTIDDGLVYALGATGILRCLDGRTGDAGLE